ncbi:MAG: heterodisulfide reductase-related iron-sulfur binding cluster, partial [Candidatus Helarchaeota archaeon]
LLEDLIKNGKIRFSDLTPLKVTYHDPCHSTKRNTLKSNYERPRSILKSIPQIELVEMRSTKFGSICCGAGGGLKSAYPDLAIW